MDIKLTALDWLVFATYFVVLAGMGWYLSQRRSGDARDYFLGGNQMPIWAVAISVMATSQSAATFLGGPDQGFRGDLTYMATNIGAFIAAFVVMAFLIPRYYQARVSTVYGLLEQRFGASAKRHAGGMYLFGRVFASGARLYMAAIAVSMVMFHNIQADSVVMSILLLAFGALAYSVVGGIRSVIYTDALQCAVYVLAALAVLGYLLWMIPADFGTILSALQQPLDGSGSKLKVIDLSLDFSSTGVFTFWSAITGFVLLNIAAFGMDQDMTQRVLTCKDGRSGASAMLLSVVMIIPVMLLFIFIGMLLYVFYQRPDLMQLQQGSELATTFAGESVTVFMYYVLNEMPAGLRGLVTVGVVAAALSTMTSGLNSMSSVLIQDLYRPWRERRQAQNSVLTPIPERHFVRAGQFGMLLTAAALSAMAVLCFYWQQYSDMPLLAFALSVMVFSYSGLLGVYFTVLFTNRGNAHSVTAALVTGFVVTLFFQPYILDAFGPWLANWDLGFTWQLCIGTLIAFVVCCLGRPVQATSPTHFDVTGDAQ
ncbi:MAG: sodium:solute symporter [Alkalimonas sp.]|nr:sodium:solute symporter [Alkalimonas sp.]